MVATYCVYLEEGRLMLGLAFVSSSFTGYGGYLASSVRVYALCLQELFRTRTLA